MMYVAYSSKALATLYLLIVTSYASTSASKPGALSPIVNKRNISAPETFEAFDTSTVAASQTKLVEAPTSMLQPDWPIICSQPSRQLALPWNKKDCLRIATQIETGPGATSFRIYGETGERLAWVLDNCCVLLRGLTVGSTDVFKPILIARSIRRVVHVCAQSRLGGTTNVGPRRKFILIISNSTPDANERAAIF